MIDKNIISVKFLSAVTKLSITACTVILYLHYFIPQSWGFFTIEPIQPLLNAYTVHKGVINNKSLIANNMSYGMGISRKGIILFNGLVKLIESNKNLVWKPLNEDSIYYITQHKIFIKITANNNISFYKGKFLFTKTGRPSYTVLKTKEKFVPFKQYILADIE